MLRFAILGFLNIQSFTGYALKRQMETSTAQFWHADLSQIYTTLKQLEKDGMATSQIEEQSDRPNRRVYTITESGKKALSGWLMQPIPPPRGGKHLLLLKLFFSKEVDVKHTLLQLQYQRQYHEESLATLQDIQQDMERHLNETPELQRDMVFWEATQRYGELYEEMYIRWLDETITKLKALNENQ